MKNRALARGSSRASDDDAPPPPRDDVDDALAATTRRVLTPGCSAPRSGAVRARADATITRAEVDRARHHRVDPSATARRRRLAGRLVIAARLGAAGGELI
jgi:hypothetical protein